MKLKVCGIEMGVDAFAASDSELYALICEGADAISAIDAAYSFIGELGLSDEVVTAHFNYQHGLVKDQLRETLESVALASGVRPKAIVVIPGFSPAMVGTAREIHAADVVSHLFCLREQVDGLDVPCFVPFHTEDLRFPLGKLMRALSLIGFTVVELEGAGGGAFSELEEDSLDDAISMLALGDGLENLVNGEEGGRGDKACE